MGLNPRSATHKLGDWEDLLSLFEPWLLLSRWMYWSLLRGAAVQTERALSARGLQWPVAPKDERVPAGSLRTSGL